MRRSSGSRQDNFCLVPVPTRLTLARGVLKPRVPYLQEEKTMKLYHFPLSPNCRRVQLAAAQLGVKFDEEQVLDITKGEHKAADFIAINPNGMVPALVDGNLKLWESRGIIQYLASKNPGSELLGKDETAKADITRWLSWDAGHLAPQVFTLVFENMLKGLLGIGAPDQVAVSQASEQLKRFFGVLDACLKGKRYLVGDSLTIADLSVAATLTYWNELEFPINEFTNLKAWFDRITALEAWKKTQPDLGKKAA